MGKTNPTLATLEKGQANFLTAKNKVKFFYFLIIQKNVGACWFVFYCRCNERAGDTVSSPDYLDPR